jgi:hypothetical protein
LPEKTESPKRTKRSLRPQVFDFFMKEPFSTSHLPSPETRVRYLVLAVLASALASILLAYH